MDDSICSSRSWGEQEGGKGRGGGGGRGPPRPRGAPQPYCSSEALCWEAVSSRPMSSWLARRQTTPRPSATASARRWPRGCPRSASVGSLGSEKCFRRETRGNRSANRCGLGGYLPPTCCRSSSTNHQPYRDRSSGSQVGPRHRAPAGGPGGRTEGVGTFSQVTWTCWKDDLG